MSVRKIGAICILVGMVLLVRIPRSVAEDAPPPTPTAPAAKPSVPDETNHDKPDAGAQPQPAPTGDTAKDTAKDTTKDSANKDAGTREAMCLMIESAAKAAGLPLEFFSRVIWQESRFQPDAVGPVTRSGERAQGIAQFMPGTANERRLLDPFDPVQALPKSAEFLSELRGEFGNLGLAAAAYNAGPRRVREWIEGSGSMPAETRNYVLAITGVSVDDWKNATDRAPDRAAVSSCRELMALLQRAPNPFVAGLEQHVKLGADLAVGRAARRRFLARSGAGDVCAGNEAADAGDRRARSDAARIDLAQPRHAHLLSGTDRHRYARRCQRPVPAHSPRRTGLSRAAEQAGEGLRPYPCVRGG